MTIISKPHDKCKKCEHKDSCDDKRMVACRLTEMQRPIMKSVATPIAENFAQPITRKHTPITIKIGEYGNINTSLEQIAEQINKEFKINCAFNKS